MTERVPGGATEAVPGGPIHRVRGGEVDGRGLGRVAGGAVAAVASGRIASVACSDDDGVAGAPIEPAPGCIAAQSPGRPRLRLAGWLGLAMLVYAPAEAQRDLGWDVRVAERVEVAAGASATLTIAIAVDRGLTVSKDAAVTVDLDPDAGVAVRKRRLGRGDAVDPEADAPRFAVPVRGETAGEHALRLHLRFWLCSARVCRPIDVRRAATVTVTPETPSADAGLDAAPRRP